MKNMKLANVSDKIYGWLRR